MYYNKKIEDIEKELKTDKNGLSTKEAKRRIKKYGKIFFLKRKKIA